MTTEEEDAILLEASNIRAKYYKEAEEKWKAMPPEQRKRPWPRCGNITCNRTLVCQEGNSTDFRRSSCDGFDF